MEKDLLNKKDIFTYFLIAATGALVQLLIGSLLQEWFSVTFRESLILAYITGAVVGFLLTKIFGFNNRNAEKTNIEMIKFSMVTLLSFLITVYGSDALFDFSVRIFGVKLVLLPHSVKKVNINKLAYQLCCMGASFISNYVLHKRFTFQNTGFYERLKKLLFR